MYQCILCKGEYIHKFASCVFDSETIRHLDAVARVICCISFFCIYVVDIAGYAITFIEFYGTIDYLIFLAVGIC